MNAGGNMIRQRTNRSVLLWKPVHCIAVIIFSLVAIAEWRAPVTATERDISVTYTVACSFSLDVI